MTSEVAERARAAEWLQRRYSIAELGRRLGVSTFIARKTRNGELSWEMFRRLRALEGDRFALHVFGLDPPAFSDLQLLRQHLEETAKLIEQTERRPDTCSAFDIVAADAATVGVPEVVERDADTTDLGDVLAGWLERWRAVPMLDAKTALRLASSDPSGRVGVVKRGRRDAFFRCLHVGGRLQFQNADGVRLAGSSTEDWQRDPYLASCVRAYGLAAERRQPVLQDVTIRPKAGLTPTEDRFRRLILPFFDRRKNTVVIVVSRALDTTHGSQTTDG